MSPGLTSLAAAFLMGAIGGAGYLAVLWASVRSLAQSRRPAARLLGGAVLRIALLLGSFYLIMDGQSERLLACLVGFTAVRIAVTRWASAGVVPGRTS